MIEKKHGKKIVIFGDSLLRPIISDGGRYSVSKAVDWASIEERLGVQIENRARMGATVRHGYAYLSDYLKSGNPFYAAVIEYGGNDCDYDWESVARGGPGRHPPKTRPEEFENTLNGMIDLLKENNVKPILTTLPPISSIKYYDWIMRKGLNVENIMKHLGDVETISRHQEYYNNIIEKTAVLRGTDLIDIRRKFLLRSDYLNLMCEDGIHPNAEGEQVIVNAFIDKYCIENKACRIDAGDMIYENQIYD